MLTYRIAEDKDLKPISTLCADAFLNYAFYTPFVKDQGKRKQAVVGEEDGEIITAFSLHEPGRKQAGFTEYLASGIGMVFRYGTIPFKWFDMYDKCIAPAERFNKENPNVYYIEILAVRPDKQRHGIGSKDIHEYMVPYVKGKGGGILSLITNSVENTKFYESNGFKCFDHMNVPAAGTEIGNWCFSMDVD